jgi:mono/diheme cytochrome c family protein
MSEPPKVFYRLRELPEGRATLALLDGANVWRGGQLAVLERQFAVEVPEGDEAKATVPGFRHALTILTPDAAREGTSQGGLWRDPTPMPDGSLLVAHAAGPIDLGDPKAAVRTELVRVVLESDVATNRPKVKTTTTVLSDPKMAISQAVAVYQRPAEDPPHPRAWDDTSATATLVHSGVQVIEAVLANLPPLAPRTLRADLAFVRAVAPLTVAGSVDVTPVPASETRDGFPSATKASLTGRMPLFVAAEVPPAADGSLAALIPPKVSVRVVTLDADRIAIGALQHQWYATLPGERFPVGIPGTSFGARCAGCHGAMDGNPSSVLKPPVDLVTQASVTQALYKGGDRRLPLDLPTVDASFFILVDFQKDVQPILDAKCASCHGGAAPAGGLSLTSAATTHYTDAYESLLKRGTGSANGYEYVDADGYRGRGSHLIERIMGRDYDAPRAYDKPCPPVGSPQLTVEEKQTLARWIELGAAFLGAPGK